MPAMDISVRQALAIRSGTFKWSALKDFPTVSIPVFVIKFSDDTNKWCCAIVFVSSFKFGKENNGEQRCSDCAPPKANQTRHGGQHDEEK